MKTNLTRRQDAATRLRDLKPGNLFRFNDTGVSVVAINMVLDSEGERGMKMKVAETDRAFVVIDGDAVNGMSEEHRARLTGSVHVMSGELVVIRIKQTSPLEIEELVDLPEPQAAPEYSDFYPMPSKPSNPDDSLPTGSRCEEGQG